MLSPAVWALLHVVDPWVGYSSMWKPPVRYWAQPAGVVQSMDVQTNEDLLDLIRSKGETPVPYFEGCTFFPPLEFVFDLLGMPEVPKQSYEQKQQPGWLTWKTFSKWMSKLPASMQLRPSQILKLTKALSSTQSFHGLLKDSLARDALWKPYPQWIVLLHRSFQSEICSAYWSGLLEAEWQLMCKILPAAPTNRARLEALANSSLMRTLGAPGSHERMHQMLASELDPNKVLASSDFINCRMSDLVSFMLRLAAWYIVDGSMSQWGLTIRAKKQNEILFVELLPVRQKDGGWTNSVEACLKYFAFLCCCPPDDTLSSSLGRIWAEHDYVQNEFPEVASRQHTLRDWLSGVKGRPKRDTVLSFSSAVAHKAASLRGHAASEAQAEIVGLVYRFHFAETSRYVLGEMQRKCFSESLIQTVFSSYEEEYRKARTLLGKPLAERKESN